MQCTPLLSDGPVFQTLHLGVRVRCADAVQQLLPEDHGHGLDVVVPVRSRGSLLLYGHLYGGENAR